MRKKIKMVDTK